MEQKLADMRRQMEKEFPDRQQKEQEIADLKQQKEQAVQQLCDMKQQMEQALRQFDDMKHKKEQELSDMTQQKVHAEQELCNMKKKVDNYSRMQQQFSTEITRTANFMHYNQDSPNTVTDNVEVPSMNEANRIVSYLESIKDNVETNELT